MIHAVILCIVQCAYFQGPGDGYICFDCCSKVSVKGRSLTSSAANDATTGPTSPKRRKLSTSTSPVHCRRRVLKRHFASSVSNAVRQAKYAQAFRQLLSCGQAARRAFNNIVAREAHRQITQYVRRQTSHFPMFDGTASLQSFSWSAVIEELRTYLPTLFAAVNSSMPNKFRANTGHTTFV